MTGPSPRLRHPSAERRGYGTEAIMTRSQSEAAGEYVQNESSFANAGRGGGGQSLCGQVG